MKTKYRIKTSYSVDGITGMPQNNYMVEEKKGLFGRWTGVQMFVTKDEAEREIKVRTLASGKVR